VRREESRCDTVQFTGGDAGTRVTLQRIEGQPYDAADGPKTSPVGL